MLQVINLRVQGRYAAYRVTPGELSRLEDPASGYEEIVLRLYAIAHEQLYGRSEIIEVDRKVVASRRIPGNKASAVHEILRELVGVDEAIWQRWMNLLRRYFRFVDCRWMLPVVDYKMEELATLVKVYQEFHMHGFAVLGDDQ